MRINGTLIGKLGGHSANSPALVDRVVEFYVTKTKLKIYLFNASVAGWHRPSQVIQIVDVKSNDNLPDLIAEYVSMLQDINNITFNDSFTYNGTKYWYRNGVEVHEVTNGLKLKYSKEITFYEGNMSGNGLYYKDLNAWENSNGIIYISECDLEELEADFQEFGQYDTALLWTRESWVKWVTDFIYDNYGQEEGCSEMLADTKFIESLAYDCLLNADWQDLSTLLNDYDYNNDWVMTNWEEWKNK